MSFQADIRNAAADAQRQMKKIRVILDREIEDSMNNNDVVRASLAYIDFRETWEELSDAVNRVKQTYATLCENNLPNMLETAGVRSVSLDSRERRVEVRVRTKCSVKADRKGQAIAWLKSTGNGEIVQPHIHPMTLSSFAADLTREGRELPQDIFTTYLARTIAWPKIKSRKG